MSAYPVDLKSNLQPMGQKDLFIYNYKNKSPILRKVTNTPFVNETYPFEFDKDHLCFLSDENGIRNRYLGVLDSAIAYVDTVEHYRYFTRTYPITNYSTNILEQDINQKSKKITEVIFNKKRFRMIVQDMLPVTAALNAPLVNTAYKNIELKRISKTKDKKKDNEPKSVQTVQVFNTEEKKPEKRDSSGIDINNYVFENEPVKKNASPPPVEIKKSPDTATAAAKAPTFQFPQQRNYFVFFSTDYVVTQLDNSFLSASYQKFSGPGPVFLSPGLTGFFKLGLSDLFDDYKVTGGVRISTDLKSNEYYMSYENRLKRLDKQIILHRQAMEYAPLFHINTHEAKYILKWPFNETTRLQGIINARQDRTVFYSVDDPSLTKPNEFEYWGGGEMDFVYDNTRNRGINLYYGTRLKLFAQYFKQLNAANSNMTVLGFDIRNYKKIHRDFIWANRLSASTSFGPKELIYYMGGVDNWFNPQFNYTIPIDYNQNYAYQTLATPMRGFTQNIRNGNSFALYNTELRMPIFRYLKNRPLKSDFLNNFQIVGFTDVGTAWTGKSPYDDDNSLYTQVFGGPPNPVTVVVQTKREPIVAGYGWGIRSRVLGYFMRLDWAHGWEDGKIGKRVFYFSLGLDF